MRAAKKLAVGLLATAALCAIVPVAASAKLPEWGRCEATAKGKYTDSGCTVKAAKRSGGFEWIPLEEGKVVKGRPLEAEGTIVFETSHGKKIECTGGMTEESYVPILGKNAEHPTPLWEMEGCEAEGQECATPFAAPYEINNAYQWGEIPNEEGAPAPGWTDRLGFISGKGGAEPVVGVAYTPNNEERLFQPIICQGEIGTVWIGGERKSGNSFISTIEPVDQMSHRFTETFTESSPGVQSPERLEGHGHRQVLEAFLENHWEPVAIVATLTYPLIRGQSLEIKATP
jgi:hypothetical protein